MNDEAANRLAGETLVLATVCAELTAEIGLLDGDPRGKLAAMLARMQGRLEGAAARIGLYGDGALECASAMTALMDHMSDAANTALSVSLRSQKSSPDPD